jgi:tRNA (cytidine/uridine-2'-O-)-methyltransferase
LILLASHQLKIVLVEPEIPQNTGNIARLCAATGAELHLVRPLGFFLTDKHFKRAGMDYLNDAKVIVHDDLSALLTAAGNQPRVMTSGLHGKPHWDHAFAPGTWIFFGRESAGLPEPLLASHHELVLRIPMVDGTRGLNLSTAAGIVLYEALRQLTPVK